MMHIKSYVWIFCFLLRKSLCDVVSSKFDPVHFRETGAGPRGERSKIIPTDHGEVRSPFLLIMVK